VNQPEKPIEIVIAEWLQIAVERFQFALRERKIGVTSALFKSFVTNIFQNGSGSISRVEILFLFYGRYVDMGVGRGFPIGGRRTNKKFDSYRFGNGKLKINPIRKPKPWYSKTKAREVGRLTTILAEQYGMNSAKVVESALDGDKITIEL
jgi:hypothetical protein